MFELRAVDIAISDDMLVRLNALRCGRADLYTLIPDGDARVRAVIERLGPALTRRSLIDEPRPVGTLKTRGPAFAGPRKTTPRSLWAARRLGPARSMTIPTPAEQPRQASRSAASAPS